MTDTSIRSLDNMTGILLAAGRGTRFDPGGMRNKLMQPLSGGEPLAVMAARRLLAALPTVVAVVRRDDEALSRALQAVGCRVTVCDAAGEGMAASLVHGISEAKSARGWVIALADMPYVRAETIRTLAAAIQSGAHIAAPMYRGQRGNPVAFSKEHLPHLLALRGDQGARKVLNAFPVTLIDTDDPGILRDIDTVGDLLQKQ